MKNFIVTQFLVLLFANTFSQNGKFEMPKRTNPTVKKESLSQAININDLSPLLWSSMQLQLSQDFWLYNRRVNNFAQPQTENYVYPQDDYKQIIEVVFAEILVSVNGKTAVAQSTSDKLTAQQKNILNKADLGSDIQITIKYKYKDQTNDVWGSRNKIIKGSTIVTIVPATEAEYPGGWKQLSTYFTGKVFNKVNGKDSYDKLQLATLKFTINEEGKITDTKIARTSTDKTIDKLLLEAMNGMPNWKPAVNSKGERVKQEINIPLGGGC
ncbi:MAG: energy transducer TonB [Bacteroidetes bacterium]|nr:energy transducer TonB [Bacteroidota bacterium]